MGLLMFMLKVLALHARREAGAGSFPDAREIAVGSQDALATLRSPACSERVVCPLPPPSSSTVTLGSSVHL